MIEIKANHVYRCVHGEPILVLDADYTAERVRGVELKRGVPDMVVVSRDRRELITPMHWTEGRPAEEVQPMPFWRFCASVEPGERTANYRIQVSAHMMTMVLGIEPDSNIARLQATTDQVYGYTPSIYFDDLELTHDITGAIAAHARRMAHEMVRPTLEAFEKMAAEKLLDLAREKGLIK